MSVEVLSRAEVFPEEVVAIAGLLEKTSPLTATALREYRRLMDLFQPW